jgi:hypothetical protein
MLSATTPHSKTPASTISARRSAKLAWARTIAFFDDYLKA